MDHRIVIGIAVGLVALAFGGFFFALTPRSPEALVPAAQMAAAPKAPAVPNAPAPASSSAPAKATPESIEAEIGRSDHAELQALLKKSFPNEYKELIAVAVQRRNDGASDLVVGQETFVKFQELMRSKLKFAVAATMPTIDRLAANEISLFNTLGTAGGRFCLTVLGKAETTEPLAPPDNIKRLMRQATIHRFEAIGEGMPQYAPISPLSPTELAAFEASLARDGLTLEEVRSGTFLNKEGNEPGMPCLMVEKLYRAVARLNEGGRRKLFSSMFFLGREN